ncbi:MAG: VOC family protein [Anaerolineae bacterium]|nr:VOC family protein [Anaerolineae bacterium]
MSPQSLHIARLHHAQITIPHGEEAHARAFYCDVLGLQEIDKPDSLKGRGGFWVMIGDQQLHIGVEDGVDRLRTRAHIAYQVDNLAGWQAQLLAHGIEIGDSISIPGYERFEFRDPFGNRVEFICPIDEETNANTTMGEQRQ